MTTPDTERAGELDTLVSDLIRQAEDYAEAERERRLVMTATLAEALSAVRREERERCAKIAENWDGSAALQRTIRLNPGSGSAGMRSVITSEAHAIASALRSPSPGGEPG